MKTLEHFVTFEKLNSVYGTEPIYVLVFILKEKPDKPLRVASYDLSTLIHLYSNFLSLSYDLQFDTVRNWFNDGYISTLVKIDIDE